VTNPDPVASAPGDRLRTLLEAPLPAVLTLYRPDGAAHATPVWFRLAGEMVEVVIGTEDRKVRGLARDPRCVLLIFETVPPFRGLEIRADGTLTGDGVAAARHAIAPRYLGARAGRVFADKRGDRGFVLRLPLAGARTWDLGAILPPAS
jgi:hypothetical protein